MLDILQHLSKVYKLKMNSAHAQVKSTKQDCTARVLVEIVLVSVSLSDIYTF